MLKPIQSILFATDLTPNCQQALDFTIAIAVRFNATIYMLHVIEKLPDHLTSGRIRGLIGRHQWKSMIESQQESAQKSLLGKQHTDNKVRQAIREFCEKEGMSDEACDFNSREIIITDGKLIEDILENAEKNECDLIVLGGHRDIFSQTSLGSTVKGVMKKSKIPVTVVPAVLS